MSIKQQVEEALANKIAEANAKYGCNIKIDPVVWKKRGLYAGKAMMERITHRSVIQLSEEAATNYFDTMINEIVPHEVAHLVCFFKGWDLKHGFRWKQVCIELGGTGARTVTIRLTRTRHINQYEYKGSLGTYWVNQKYHDRMQKHEVMVVRHTKERIKADMWSGSVRAG